MHNFNIYGQSNIHPFGLIALCICIVTVFIIKREYVIIPLLLMITFIPSAQRIVIFSVDFNFIRIIIIFIFLRLVLKREYLEFTIQRTDVYIILWLIWSVIAFAILNNSMSALVTRLGYMVEAAGSYFIARVYVRSLSELRLNIYIIGWISLPVVFFFLVERATGRNLFSVFGGVPEITLIRGGRLRCQGSFSHPIMAGIFWASIVMWILAFMREKVIPKWKLLIFFLAALIIVINTASSTPVMSLIFGIVGFTFFKFRKNIRSIKWFILFLLLTLHMIMDAPVWHLISRIDIVSGSTGWHRYHLIDEFINRVEEWWIVGVVGTGHWGYGLRDVTNQYVLEGVRGGLLSLVLFSMILMSTFNLIGKTLELNNSSKNEWIIWSVGVVLFMHMMNFIAASYFGTLVSAFYLFLGASISIMVNFNKNMQDQVITRQA